MSQLIKKHRRQIFGVAMPVFFLFILTVAGLSVFPGWIKPTYSTPGAACTFLGTTSTDPLMTACDPCAGEFCSFVNSTLDTCVIGSFVPCPSCQCDVGVFATGNSQFTLTTTCGAPDDSYCAGLAGGDAPNACRTASCQISQSVDYTNPSGCDYNFNSADTDCINCAPPTATSENCGNGVCEIDDGETMASCAVDCRVPGFPFATPLPEGDTILNAACEDPSSPIKLLGFGTNIVDSDSCEDGDICTTNSCIGGDCVVDPAVCDAIRADLCCPAGCTDTTDIDCLPPQDCVPTPQPTPTPTVLPGPPLEVSGNSVIGCSMHAGDHTSTFGIWLMGSVLALSAIAIRGAKRKAS